MSLIITANRRLGKPVFVAPPINSAPVIVLTSPTNGYTTSAPGTVQLAATASDPDGTVLKVEFYRGVTLIATVTSAPYVATDSNVPAGTYPYTGKVYDSGSPPLSTVSAAVNVTITNPVVIVPPSGPSSRVLVSEDQYDHPTWTSANQQLMYPFAVRGGAYRDASNVQNGSNHYAQAAINTASEQRLTITGLGPMVTQLRLDNTGFYIHQNAGAFVIASKESTKAPPTLTVVTDVQPYTLTPSHDGMLIPTGGINGGDDGVNPGTGDWTGATLNNFVIIKFDLSGVQGTVSSANLAVTITSGGQTLYVNYLDTPALITDPVTQIPGAVVEAGLRGTYTETQIADGSTVPAIIFYGKMNATDIPAQWTGVPTSDDFNKLQSATAFGGPPINRFTFKASPGWPSYNVDVMRIGTRNFGSVASPNFAQTLASYKKFFTAPGYDELYHSCTLMVDADVRLGFNDQAVKLPPALSNHHVFDLPDATSDFALRMEHGGASAAHPDVYRWFGYNYDATRVTNPAINPDRGRTDLTSVCLAAGRIYSVERHVKNNTFTGPTANSDGIDEIWVDGVKVYTTNTRKFVVDATQKIDTAELICFHGGSGFPVADIHYEFGPQVVSTQYIGPLKKSYPAWRQGMAVGVFTDIPNTRLDSLSNTGAAFTDWAGLAYDYVNLRWYCAAAGGHGDPFSTADFPNGVHGIDFKVDSPAWTTKLAASAFADWVNVSPYYYDNTPSAGHTYYGDWYIPSLNRIFVFGNAALAGKGPGGAQGDPGINAFRTSDNQWDNQGTWDPTRTSFTRTPIYPFIQGNIRFEIPFCQDRRTGDVYQSYYERSASWTAWFKFDAASNLATSSVTTALIQSEAWDDCGTECDTLRNRLVAASNSAINGSPLSIFTLDLGTGARARHTVTGLGSEPDWAGHTALTHDTKRDKYMLMSKLGRVYEIDPVTWAATVRIGADTNPFNGAYNRFTYCPELDGCFYAPDINRNLQFLALA